VNKKVRALSKGNRQKVQLIAAFAGRADLLILDEPTSGLDPLMEVAFRETVLEAKGRGQTVFLSSHIIRAGLTRRRVIPYQRSRCTTSSNGRRLSRLSGRSGPSAG
jgi:ABC-type multidrug transport system ATPase subunit